MTENAYFEWANVALSALAPHTFIYLDLLVETDH